MLFYKDYFEKFCGFFLSEFVEKINFWHMKRFIFILSALLFLISSTFADGKIVVSSYPWQKVTIEEMLADFNKMGFDKVSMFQNMKLGGNGKYAKAVFRYNMSKEARAEAKAMFEKAKVKVVSIGHIYLDNENEIRKLFEFAKYFGIEVMTVEAQPNTLSIYDKLSKEYGVKCGLYNHPNSNKPKFPYGTPEKMLSAINGKEVLRAFPDCGHWGRSNFDIVECAKKLRGKMIAVNVQNLAPDMNCEEYSKGRLPIKKFVEELKAGGFNGYYIVMFNKAPDRSQIDKVLPSVKFLESCGVKR